jgi:hypothetical protein
MLDIRNFLNLLLAGLAALGASSVLAPIEVEPET